MKREEAADEGEALREGGFRAVKLRLGDPTIDEDLAVTRAVRRRLPDEIALMVDYNQALTVNQALDRGRALDREGIAWIEEPIRHDEIGSAHVRTPVTNAHLVCRILLEKNKITHELILLDRVTPHIPRKDHSS